MALLSRFSESLWSFVSPRKTQQRREKPFKAPSLSPTVPRLNKREGSPLAPTIDQKRARFDSPFDAKSEPSTDLYPFFPTYSVKRALSDLGELEGDTIIHDDEKFDEDNEATLIDLTGEEVGWEGVEIGIPGEWHEGLEAAHADLDEDVDGLLAQTESEKLVAFSTILFALV